MKSVTVVAAACACALAATHAAAQDAPLPEPPGDGAASAPSSVSAGRALDPRALHADGKWTLGGIVRVNSSRAEYGVRGGIGVFATELLRADIFLQVLGRADETFSTAGLTIPGVQRADPRGKSVARSAAIELAGSYLRWRSEPWLAIGLAVGMAEAEVSGRGRVCDLLRTTFPRDLRLPDMPVAVRVGGASIGLSMLLRFGDPLR